MATQGLQPMPLFEPKAGQQRIPVLERFGTFLVASNIKDPVAKELFCYTKLGLRFMKYSRHYQTQEMKKILIRLYKHLPNILNRSKIEFTKHTCSGKQLNKRTKSLTNIRCWIWSRLRKKALKESDYSLPKDILIDGWKSETNPQASDIEEKIKHAQLNKLEKTPTKSKFYNCGFAYPHLDRPCPAGNSTS